MDMNARAIVLAGKGRLVFQGRNILVERMFAHVNRPFWFESTGICKKYCRMFVPSMILYSLSYYL